MRETLHAKLLCMLIYGSLTRSDGHIFSRMKYSQVKAAIENLAEDVLTFFSDADSFDRDWLMPKDDREVPWEQGAFFLTFEIEEDDATERAKLGDFRALEDLILKRGYLRSSTARRLVVDRMNGVRKLGATKTKANLETLMQVAQIQVANKCSEYRAREIWLDTNPNVPAETLNSRLKRAKKSKDAEGILLLLGFLTGKRVQNSDNSEP